ncbi:hypothetical protein I4U23_000487 [Adineta vaga]|nr:hypothetical protein I4U23_000487 [Adineta vaga]
MNQPDGVLHHDQQAALLNSIDFFTEINRFKARLDVLERERFELEDKVRRLQAENRTYKNHFYNETNDWNGSRSIAVLNGHPISLSATGVQMSSFIFNQYLLKQGQTIPMRENRAKEDTLS